SETAIARGLKRSVFAAKTDAFLASEGAVAWLSQSYRDGGLLHGEGYSYRVDQTPKVPGIELAAEDYRRLARLAKTDAAPTVELTSAVRYYDDDHNAYNIIAEIPGRDPKAGYVMAGAHLASWVAARGANDNGRGPGGGGGKRRRRGGGEGDSARADEARRETEAHDPLRALVRRGARPARLDGLRRAAS